MEDIKQEIKDLHKLHSVTKDFNHIIEYQPGSWKMFEPSKFIYSFFAFNTFYNYDWEASIANDKLTPFVDDLSERQKFKKMIDFVFNNIHSDDTKDFINVILQPNKKIKPRTKDELIKALEHITPDNRISESTIEDFKNAFKKLLETEKLVIGKLKNEIIPFVYNVRNNIFHGTKTTIDMADRKQRERLNIYSSILIATNSLLFKVLERKLNFELDKKYTIRL